MPDSVTVCGLPAELSLTLSNPVRAPVAVGLNITFIVQSLPRAATEPPQSSLSEAPGVRLPISTVLLPPDKLRVSRKPLIINSLPRYLLTGGVRFQIALHGRISFLIIVN